MARTNQKKTQAAAKAKTKSQDEAFIQSVQEKFKSNLPKQTNYEFFVSLGYEQMADCIEHMILNRIFDGDRGFLTDIQKYDLFLEDQWNAVVENHQLARVRGWTRGSAQKWLTKRNHEKLSGCTKEQLAKWFTMWLQNWYILQILHGNNKQLPLAGESDKQILLWLEDV